MPVCSICEDNKPKSGYSNKQIKNKGKRRCKECVALTEEEIVTRYGELKDGKRVKLQGDLENTHTLTQHKGNDKEIVNEYEFKSKVDAFGLAAKARGTVLDMEALSLETIAGVGGYQALRYGMLLQRRKNLYTLDEKLTNPLDIAKKFAPNKTNQVRMRANRTPSLEEMLATGDSYMTGFHGAQRDPNYACQLYFGSAWGDEEPFTNTGHYFWKHSIPQGCPEGMAAVAMLMRMKLVRTQHPEQANTMFELNCKTGITPDQMNEESVTNSPAMMTVMLAAAARSGRFYCQEMMELLKELPVKRFNEKTLDPILAKNVQDLRDAEVRYLQHRQTIMLTELLEKTRAKMIIKRKKVRDEREKKKKAQLKKKTQEKARKERKAQKKAAKEQEELKQRKEEREQNLREKAAVADPETANQEPVAIKSEKQETIVVQDEQKKEEEVEEDEEECCICLDDIADDEKWTSVNACMHCFHMSCISEWKAQCRSKELEPTCPLCRQTL